VNLFFPGAARERKRNWDAKVPLTPKQRETMRRAREILATGKLTFTPEECACLAEMIAIREEWVVDERVLQEDGA
jgi:hypothetical protein